MIEITKKELKQPPDPSTYIPPDWSGTCIHDNICLEAIKNGEIKAKLTIPKGQDFVLIGRNDRICHIAVPIDLVSRQHAVITFNKHGEMFACDLGTSHGTLLNSKKMAAEVYEPLYVGDQLQFADGSVTFIVYGPEELMSPDIDEDLTSSMNEVEVSSDDIIPENNNVNVESGETDFGIEWDEPVEEAEDEWLAPSGWLDIDRVKEKLTLTTKQENMIKKFEEKIKRLEKLHLDKSQMEDEKAVAKAQLEDETEGKVDKLDKLMVRIEQMEGDLVLYQNNVRSMLNIAAPESQGGIRLSRAARQYAATLDNEDDDFYDRTDLECTAKPQKKVVLTESSLIAALQELEVKQLELKTKLEELAVSNNNDMDTDVDPLDAFMNKNQQCLNDEKRKLFNKELTALENEIRENQRLLRICQRGKQPDIEMNKDGTNQVQNALLTAAATAEAARKAQDVLLAAKQKKAKPQPEDGETDDVVETKAVLKSKTEVVVEPKAIFKESSSKTATTAPKHKQQVKKTPKEGGLNRTDKKGTSAFQGMTLKKPKVYGVAPKPPSRDNVESVAESFFES
eukprot:GHVL01014624.1.p1 GENE.GHVL01014624.1~~GHVL01014624.1.p1  ORF type:complete len:566 (+),score=123.71 GHVL01014624.1:48-1745(+)